MHHETEFFTPRFSRAGGRGRHGRRGRRHRRRRFAGAGACAEHGLCRRAAAHEYNEDYARRRSHHLGKLEKLITEVIRDVAKREGLDVVFQQVVYASEDIDLTDTVLEELKKRHQP